MKVKWQDIAGQWNLYAIEARKTWTELSDDELVRVNGNRNTLASIVQERYFITKKEAHTQIEMWIDELNI